MPPGRCHVDNRLYFPSSECIVFGNQGFHTFVHLFRLYRFFTTHLVRKPFVVANSKPRLAAVRSVCLEYCVQMLYVWFCYLVRCMLNDIVDTTEMIDGLHDVIHRRALCRDAKRVGLEDKTRLFLCQTATLYVIRI